MPDFRIEKKRGIDQAVVLNTPLATDADLSTGLLTLLDENGGNAIVVKVSDILGYKKEAYSAGTAHVVDVDLTSAVLANNTLYSLTVVIPNFVNPESNAIYTTRTYTVSTDASASVAELQTAFVNAINADTANTNLTATAEAGDVVRITAGSAEMGQLVVSTIVQGATVADQTAYVAPVGTPTDVSAYLAPVQGIDVAGNQYDRYTLKFRVYQRHNDVSGLKVVREHGAYLFVEINAGAGYTAFETALDAILDGTATAADYLGAPAL